MRKSFNDHTLQGCLAIEGQQIKLPKWRWNNENRTSSDFEHLTQKYRPVNTKTLNTDKCWHHGPCDFTIYVVNAFDGSTEKFLYRGEDCMDVSTTKLIEVKDRIMAKMGENKETIKTAKTTINIQKRYSLFHPWWEVWKEWCQMSWLLPLYKRV